MIVISHRGNTTGRDIKKENIPEHISDLISNNINCEIDIWYKDNSWFIGHDSPDTVVSTQFLQLPNLWCHCKNLNALIEIQKLNVKHFFWHEEDSYTLTSSGYIWTYFNKPVSTNCIIVDNTPDWRNKNYNCFGVCTDYIK
jgi:hypothetical protein